MGLLAFYCGHQFRHLENCFLGLDPAVLDEASDRLLELLGYRTFYGCGITNTLLQTKHLRARYACLADRCDPRDTVIRLVEKRASLRVSRNAKAMGSHASDDSMVASKSFARRLARLIQPNVLSPAFGQHDEAFDVLIVTLDHGDGDAARLERGALRLIAIVA